MVPFHSFAVVEVDIVQDEEMEHAFHLWKINREDKPVETYLRPDRWILLLYADYKPAPPCTALYSLGE